MDIDYFTIHTFWMPISARNCTRWGQIGLVREYVWYSYTYKSSTHKYTRYECDAARCVFASQNGLRITIAKKKDRKACTRTKVHGFKDNHMSQNSHADVSSRFWLVCIKRRARTHESIRSQSSSDISMSLQIALWETARARESYISPMMPVDESIGNTCAYSWLRYKSF